YCYLAGSSILGMYLLPAWVQEGGIDATLARLKDPATWPRLREHFGKISRADPYATRISYAAHPDWRKYEGMTALEAIGGDRGRAGGLVAALRVAGERAAGGGAPPRQRGEEDVCGLTHPPAMMGGSDGIFTGSRPHPRGCGCYARYLGHYVREGVWTLETAV